MIKEQVFSPIEDKSIVKKSSIIPVGEDGESSHLEKLWNSPIWDKAKHLEDVTDEDKKSDGFVYTILFDGTIPTKVASFKKL